MSWVLRFTDRVGATCSEMTNVVARKDHPDQPSRPLRPYARVHSYRFPSAQYHELHKKRRGSEGQARLTLENQLTRRSLGSHACFVSVSF